MTKKYMPGDPVPAWSVGEFISSSDPRKLVLMIAAGDDIAEYGAHRDFVRWIYQSPAQPDAQPEDGEGPEPLTAEQAAEYAADPARALRSIKVTAEDAVVNGDAPMLLWALQDIAQVSAAFVNALAQQPQERPAGDVATRKAALWSVVRRYGKGLAFASEVDEALDTALSSQPSQQAAQAAPGWKLVPLEPTKEMLSAVFACVRPGTQLEIAQTVWQAMLSAAPPQPAVAQGEGPLRDEPEAKERFNFVLTACRDAQDVASQYGWALHAIAQGATDPVAVARAALLGNSAGALRDEPANTKGGA